MTDRYFASLLLVGGICIGFTLHAASLAAQTRSRRYVFLTLLSLLEGAYCLLVWRYLSIPDPERARPWGLSFCAFTPYITWVFGELTMDLVERRPRWLTKLQTFNLVVTMAFTTAVVVDLVFRTSLVVTPRILTDLASLHRHRVVFTPIGQAYLGWVSTAFCLFAVLLFRGYRTRRDLFPMVLGCVIYFVATIKDFGIVVGLYDGHFLQHFGFFALVTGAWRVLANRFRQAVQEIKLAMTRLEEQRRQLLVAAPLLHKQKLDSLGTLAAGVAHEINNPVQGIMNYARLLKRRVDPGTPASNFADEIESESKRIAEIVQMLLRFGRTDSPVAVAAEVKEIVDGTLTLIRTSLLNDGIKLEVRVEDRLPEITCRAAQLQQVIMNLVTNARDALAERDPLRTDPKVITIEASQRQRDGETWLVLGVSDNGEGIDPAVADCIFDPFFTTKGAHGTGLGLSVSHDIAKAHGGDITCESEVGRGTSFRVQIPCAPRRHTESVDRALMFRQAFEEPAE